MYYNVQLKKNYLPHMAVSQCSYYKIANNKKYKWCVLQTKTQRLIKKNRVHPDSDGTQVFILHDTRLKIM